MDSTTKVQPIDEVKDPIRQKSTDLNKPQMPLIIGGLIVAAILLIYLMATENIVQPLLLVIGLLVGYTLLHARFGFAAALRRLVSVGNGQSLSSPYLLL